MDAAVGGLGHSASGQPNEVRQVFGQQHGLRQAGRGQLDQDDNVLNSAPLVQSGLPLLAPLQIPDPAGQRNVDVRLRIVAGEFFGHDGRRGEDVRGQRMAVRIVGVPVRGAVVLRGRHGSDGQHAKAALAGRLGQQTYPGGAPFPWAGRSQAADQAMVGRDAEAVLQSRPGAEGPLLLGGLLDAVQVAQRGQYRKTGDAFHVCASFEPFIHEFDA